MKVMRLGPSLAVVLVSLIGPGGAHADELMRLCGPRGVGFIRTSRGQACLYNPETNPTPPALTTPGGPTSPAPNSGSPSQPTASGKS